LICSLLTSARKDIPGSLKVKSSVSNKLQVWVDWAVESGEVEIGFSFVGLKALGYECIGKKVVDQDCTSGCSVFFNPSLFFASGKLMGVWLSCR
jgi:hypothetical protein